MKKTMLSKTMMGRTAVKVLLATTLLAGVIAGQVGPASATAAKPTAAPIMRDNLSKYGLVKDVELPVTVEAGGLSYTLEKIMIYDAKSKDAQALIKKYGYNVERKYFIWTKITITNNSKTVVQFSSKDLSEKWRLYFGKDALTVMPQSSANKLNSKDALWVWKLEPGKKLSTYQAFSYDENFKTFVIWVDNKGQFTEKYIVKRAVE
ncbi:hypothetical protein [Paenibacillus sp. FSL H8-0259]|uniref:hypothetical protein n=1 Tax=Paenibacillus sp. FSL H8-0259 TaxID=1920423 RepID=UPI00096C815A|nr:hypothetical protein [Paenibacillus sp. FSL H8-0259]OMF32885.1 hypothetical protein BK132_01200 [Paenibacillus sp. FSL H8-0259]